MAAEREEIHSALTDLFAPGGALNQRPDELTKYFDDLAIVRTAHAYMQLQSDVSAGGQAVVVTAGPPGAGKTAARKTMSLGGYRIIDADIAKDLLLTEAERQGLLAYRHSHMLPDGQPVSVRELSSHIHSMSTRTVDIVRGLALAAGENIVIEGTLFWDPLVTQYIGELFDAGYEDLDVVDVEASLAIVLERAKVRWWDDRQSEDLGGRFVPDQAISTCFPDPSGASVCATNALALAERAGSELGRGTLRRFDVDPRTGEVILSSETTFRGPSPH